MNFFEKLRSAAVGRRPSARVIGIDLGTTNSTVAVVTLPLPTDSNPETACSDLSIEQMTLSGPTYSTLVPSVVAIDTAGHEWIGEGAKRLRAEAVAHGLSPERNLFSETKNDMGISKTYHRATDDYDHARKIAAKVLRFLAAHARKAAGSPVARTVVTVPASFQVNQRADTLWAAAAAKLGIADEDLLDEPVAALTDYLFTYAKDDLFPAAKSVLVFDFGGGTCDVFLCRVEPRPDVDGLNVTALSVSRYHRLGGYDFDAAIIHEHLIPALLKEHNLTARHFGWAERKKIIEPALRSCAEALKEGLCREIKQLQEHGRYSDADKAQVIARMVSTPVRVGKQEFILSNPTLNAKEWENLLTPFLSVDMLHCRETDYRQEMSIFTPITDALMRAKVSAEDIDYVLLAGGSSLIPQVQEALAKYFKKAYLLRFPDSTAAQSAIARGAAWSAAWLDVFSEPLVKPMVGDSLALRVEGRAPLVLIPAGTSIPFPADGGWKSQAGLTLPREFNGKLKVELISLPDEQIVLHCPIELARRHAGEPIEFQFRLTAARRLEAKVGLKSKPNETHDIEVENPLVSVASPGNARMEIEQIEEELRDAGGPGPHHRSQLLRLASLYRQLRMYEKAVEILKSATVALKQADVDILNLQGIIFEELGDFNRMEACYREAAKLTRGGTPWFNWALHCHRQKRYDTALEKIDEGSIREPTSSPYHSLRAQILKSMGKGDAAKEAAQQALNEAKPLNEQSAWELAWFEDTLVLLGEKTRLAELRAERGHRSAGATEPASDGQSPAFAGS